MKRSVYPRGILVLALILIFSSVLSALTEIDMEDVRTELSGPATIELTDGRTISGKITSASTSSVRVYHALDSGDATYPIDLKQIEHIRLPGGIYQRLAIDRLQQGDSTTALAIMELLFEQRGPLLDALPEAETHYFFRFVELVLDSPHPARAIAITSTLETQKMNDAARRAFNYLLLKSFHQLGLDDRAEAFARTWMQTYPSGDDSDLAHYILARSALRDQQYEAAIDLALTPVAMGWTREKNIVAKCRAIAASAAYELNDFIYLDAMLADMEAMNETWPLNDALLNRYSTIVPKFLHIDLEL